MRAPYLTSKHTTNLLSSVHFPWILRKNIHYITAHVCVLRSTYIGMLCSLLYIYAYMHILAIKRDTQRHGHSPMSLAELRLRPQHRSCGLQGTSDCLVLTASEPDTCMRHSTLYGTTECVKEALHTVISCYWRCMDGLEVHACIHFGLHRNRLNGTHQLLAYADDLNILRGSVHTLKENAEALVAATRETGLEVVLIKLSTWSCLEIRMQDEFT